MNVSTKTGKMYHAKTTIGIVK